ncbi:MAG TPA: CocE/NonD family hydrolase [Gemmatimonadaceae bacterium]|nr:CocE/NonD family hydrolase [Gemmatimonadaceae bacterium]
MTRTRLPFLLAVALGSFSHASAQARTQFGVTIPMRDGVKLAADIWLPESPGRYPVLLARTPYMKSGLGLNQWARYFAAQGYVFVIQDTRGRGDSEGQFEFFFTDGKDGFDSIEWLAKQPFSNGRVGTLGLSYLGTVQWLAAREQPPALKCMAPTASGGRWFEELPYMGGAFAHAFALQWVNQTSGRTEQSPNGQTADWTKVLAHRPLLTADSVLGRVMPMYREWLSHSTYDAYWARLRFTARDFAGITIPTLTTTGWYDGDQPGALFYWRGVMANTTQRDRHFLVVGPWRHIETFRGGSLKVGDSEFSAESIIDNKAVHLAFFDWCLKQSSARYDAPRARIYVTGANVWRTHDSYPPASAAPRTLYLTSGGNANTSSGDGMLAWQSVDSPPDRFVFDPKKPVPDDMDSWGVDRRPIQARRDVLVYTSEPLSEAVEVIGSVTVNLQAASDARDTDFTAALSDVLPDGRALALGPIVGIKRARYRKGYDAEELLTRGKPESFRIELFDIAHSFERGHRIRLEISSSAAPLYNPNQNTGNPVATDTVWKVANQTIFHDRARASFLSLPVLARKQP